MAVGGVALEAAQHQRDVLTLPRDRAEASLDALDAEPLEALAVHPFGRFSVLDVEPRRRAPATDEGLASAAAGAIHFGLPIEIRTTTSSASDASAARYDAVNSLGRSFTTSSQAIAVFAVRFTRPLKRDRRGKVEAATTLVA